VTTTISLPWQNLSKLILAPPQAKLTLTRSRLIGIKPHNQLLVVLQAPAPMARASKHVMQKICRNSAPACRNSAVLSQSRSRSCSRMRKCSISAEFLHNAGTARFSYIPTVPAFPSRVRWGLHRINGADGARSKR
jgi:hypothetical protein